MRHSDSIAEITKAMIKAQSQIKAAKMTATNPFYHSKYATLGDVWDVVKPVLQPNGLAVFQTLGYTDIGPSVTTMIAHTSGEFIEDTISMAPEKNTPQGAGIAITYMRRYSVSTYFDVINEEDTDGNIPPADTNKKPAPKKPKVDTEALFRRCQDGEVALKEEGIIDEAAFSKDMKELENIKDNPDMLQRFLATTIAQYNTGKKKRVDSEPRSGRVGAEIEQKFNQVITKEVKDLQKDIF